MFIEKCVASVEQPGFRVRVRTLGTPVKGCLNENNKFRGYFLNSHHKLLRLAVMVCILLSFSCWGQDVPSTEQEETVRLYDDPRVVAWSRDYLAGKEQVVLDSVEQDLRSGRAHPFAALIWTEIHRRRKRLPEVWANLEDSPLRASLGALPEIILLRDQDRYRELLEKYPAREATSITDIWALVYLAFSARELARSEDAVAFLMAAARLYPMHFQIAWMLEDHLTSDTLRAQVARAVEPGSRLAETPVGKHLTASLAVRPWGDLDLLAAVDRWLELFPADARAMSAKGNVLGERRHDQASLDWWLRAMETFPFYYTGYAPQALLRLNKETEARDLIQRISSWFRSDSESREIRIEQKLAAALRKTGNKGRARQVLEKALESWPENEDLIAEQVELEMADNRPDHALVYAQRGFEQSPDNTDNQERLLRVMREAGDSLAAFEQFEKFIDSARFRSRTLYHNGSKILRNLERKEVRVTLMKRAIEDYPASPWMYAEYAVALKEAGHAKAAWDNLRHALELNPAYTWAAGKIVEFITAAEGRSAALNQISEWTERYPWQRAFWEQRVELLDGPDVFEQRIGVWQEAIEENEGWYWPVERLLVALTEEERWHEASQIVDSFYDRAPRSPSDEAIRHDIRAYLVVRWAKHEDLDSSLLEQALEDNETYKFLYGKMNFYYAIKASLLWKLDRKSEAARVMLALAQLEPDDTSYFHQLVTRYGQELGSANTIGRGAIIAERNPFDGEKLKSVARAHAVLGTDKSYSCTLCGEFVARKHALGVGSPIIALKIIKEMEKRGLETSSIESLKGIALGQLGDSITRFETGYRDIDNIPDSDRFIDWYETARKKVILGSRDVNIVYDAEFPTAEIRLPNGEVLMRVDHPVSGRVRSLSIGRAFIRAEFDAAGDYPVRVHASSGSELSLSYDKLARLTRITPKGGQEVWLGYNTQNQISELTANGVGTTYVTYDENDQIVPTNTVGMHGQTVDDSIGREIISVYEQYESLLELFKDGSEHISSLPFKDEKRDTLYSKYETSCGDVQERAATGLKYSRYLVEHLTDDFDYSTKAHTILSGVFETGRNNASLPLRLLAGEAAVLWSHLTRKTKRLGISVDDFILWSEMLEWLGTEAKKGDDKRFENWRAEVATPRLELHESDQWLTGSDLQNSGFWRRHANNALLPKAPATTHATVALIRHNGDVVVGSQVGLSVLRRGFWEWFGYDDRTGRFSITISDNSVSNTSEVLSLAETDDGVLWVGTANGLYALEDTYAGPVRRWRTETKGLPSPRIEQLLAYGSEVLIGTLGGLSRGTIEGISPLDMFDDQNIRVLALAGRKDVAGDEIEDTLVNVAAELTDKEAMELVNTLSEVGTTREAAIRTHQILLGTLEPSQELLVARTQAGEAFKALQNRGLCPLGHALVDELYELINKEQHVLTGEEIDQLEEIYRSTNEPEVFLNEVTDLLGEDPVREKLTMHLQARQAQAPNCAAIEEFDTVLNGVRWAMLQTEIRSLKSELDNEAYVTALSEVISLLSSNYIRSEARMEILRDGAERLQELSMMRVPVLVGTDTAVYVTNFDSPSMKVTTWPVEAAVWAQSMEKIVLLRDKDIYEITWTGDGKAGEPVLLHGQGKPDYEKQIYGLALVQVPAIGEAVLVMTDQGMSFYRDWHYEFMPLPLEHQRLGLSVGPRTVASGREDMHFLTDEGLYSFERGQIRWPIEERVYDIVADRDRGLIYVARGNAINVVDENDPDLNVSPLSRHRTKHLALDAEGRLVANDGYAIIRFDSDMAGQKLFDASPTKSGEYGDGPVRDIFVSSDNTIWVAVGGSVFRWKDGEVEEFSFFLAPDRFPSRTHMISWVLETIEGNIWVVGSGEEHLSHQGVVLEGGLLEWTGEAFRRIQKPDGYRMITGYTQIDDRTAIVGSTSGFYRHTSDGHYQSFMAANDATYRQLRTRTPLLWLGRKGTHLGDQSWLFPSAGGVLLYHQRRWLYPERLNQMLPHDQRLGQYGGRTVHAVAADSHGRIYAGTDLGLLIYDAGGGVASLMIDNDMSSEVFNDAAVKTQRQIDEILLDRIDPRSKQGKILADYSKLEQKIQELQEQIEGGKVGVVDTSTPDISPGVNDTSQEGPERPDMKKELQNNEQKRLRLLSKLEKENIALYQMIKLNPLELSALHKELSKEQAVVQYLPTPKKLYIQLVTQDGAQITEVKVTDKELYQLASKATNQLACRSKHKISGSKKTELEGKCGSDLTGKLAWLYNQLLRPIEHELAKFRHVFIVPAGALTKLPFPALVYDHINNQPKYAVERFAMGVLPSLFHLQFVLNHEASDATSSLLVGNPTGDLPGAIEEVKEIHEILKVILRESPPPLIQDNATFGKISSTLAEGSRVLHFATHGVKNPMREHELILKLAPDKDTNGYFKNHLNVPDISRLNLEKTDLVVLSACETGIGFGDGLEYATLARAFTYALVPTVVASLWKVEDIATKDLMIEFYKNLKEMNLEDVFIAMANAQRTMISRNDVSGRHHPETWSAFLVFGKP